MDEAIAAVRRFNRFFTQYVGALDADFLGTDMSLAEARLLFEVAHREAPLASDLVEALEMDAGFVSRVLRRFEQRGLVERGRTAGDARRRPISLSERGREVFERLDARQRDEVRAALAPLREADRRRLTAALGAARALLGREGAEEGAIRTFRPGDLGLLVSRQAVLYHEAYGWGPGLEANEAATVAAFLERFKPGREQGWVAEVGGEMAGSVLLTDEGGGLCRLRLLYVEPWAQGRGIGAELVRTCLRFAAEVGYARMTLWTHSVLESARRIYAREGFRVVGTQDHDSFGPVLTGETWELDLPPSGAIAPAAAPA